MIATVRDTSLWICRRSIWLAGLVSHGYWLAESLSNGSASIGSTGLLAATLILFLLKTIDVRFLRVRWTHRSVLAAVLIVLVAHIGVISSVAASDSCGLFAWLPVESTLIVAAGKAARGALTVLVAAAAIGALRRQAFFHVSCCQFAVTSLAVLQRRRVVSDLPTRAPPR